MTKDPDFKTITEKLREIGEGEALPLISVPPFRRRPAPKEEPGAGTPAPGSAGSNTA